DHALTRPWTVVKTYRRSAEARPRWDEYTCVWESNTMRIGDDTYLVDKDGFLRPAKKDQAPPSLKYFPAQRCWVGVVPAPVAGIHVFLAGLQRARRGWPGQARP